MCGWERILTVTLRSRDGVDVWVAVGGAGVNVADAVGGTDVEVTVGGAEVSVAVGSAVDSAAGDTVGVTTVVVLHAKAVRPQTRITMRNIVLSFSFFSLSQFCDCTWSFCLQLLKTTGR